jgi:hypothetical protein
MRWTTRELMIVSWLSVTYVGGASSLALKALLLTIFYRVCIGDEGRKIIVRVSFRAESGS